MPRETIFQRLRYPEIDGGDVDMELDYMEKRLRALKGFAIGVQSGGYPHDASEDLCGGIEALYVDWIRFRRTVLPEAIAEAVKDNTITVVAEGKIVSP